MKSYRKKLFETGAAVIIVYLFIYYWSSLASLLSSLAAALSSLLAGAVTAYILNILMSYYEKHFLRKRTGRIAARLRRPMCIAFAILTLFLIICLIIFLIIPEFLEGMQTLISQIRNAASSLSENEMLADFLPQEVLSWLSALNWSNAFETLKEFLKSGITDFLGTVLTKLPSVASMVVSGFMAFICSIYILVKKETLKAHFSILLETCLSAQWNGRIRHIYDVFNDAFRGFIRGQSLEALLLGAMCTAILLLFHFPYAAMIGAIIAVTSLIPLIGLYLGAIAGTFMLLIQTPWRALFFVIIIIILQQIESNVIFPHTGGSALKIPGIWILAAITVGATLFGLAGMFFLIPFTAALYRLIKEAIIKRRQARMSEEASGEMPVFEDSTAARKAPDIRKPQEPGNNGSEEERHN